MAVLKGLVEDGEMILADGRRILRNAPPDLLRDPNVVPLHPNFRMIVLANRPGYAYYTSLDQSSFELRRAKVSVPRA